MEEITFSLCFAIIFWVIAFIFSLFYSFKAFSIHEVTPRKENWPWTFHQHWFNFIGSITGWVVLWIVLPTFYQCIVNQCVNPLSFKDIILFLVAILGITGYIPLTLYGIARSFNELVNRLSNNK